MGKLVQLLIFLPAVIAAIAKQEFCTTPGCLQEALDILDQVDVAVDPCDDFFNFACGKLIDNAGIYKNLYLTPIQKLNEKIEKQLSEIIQEPIDEEDHYKVNFQKKLFQSCMNKTALEEESLDAFKHTLEELNGWPVVMGFSWKGRFFDWAKTMSELRKRGYHSHSMLHIDGRNDPVNEKKTILYVDIPSVGDVIHEYKEEYLKYMTGVAEEFGAQPHLAEIEMEKVLDFMMKLKKISDNTGMKHVYDEDSFTRITVQEIQENNPQINWLEFINSILSPVEGISSEDYVMFPKKEYITAFFNLIWRTPKRVQANYIIWSVLEGVVSLLSKELKQLEAQYKCYTYTPRHFKDHFEFCETIVTSNVILPLPSFVTYTRRYLPVEKRKQVQELFLNVESELLSLLYEASWMDKESKDKALDKAHGLIESIGMKGNYFDNEIFDEHDAASYDEIEDDNFFTMLYNARKQFKNVWLSQIHENTSVLELRDSLFAPRIRPIEMYDYNAIIFPAGLLEEIYQTDRPMYMNYGAAGFVMGRVLTNLFSKRGSSYDKDGDRNSIWTNQTARGYDKEINCVFRDEERLSQGKLIDEINTEDIIADITGLKVAYAAYKKWVRENGEELQLPGVQYTPSQLFWISAMSHQCFKLNTGLYDTSMNDLNAFNTAAPMRNNNNFAKDFNCPVNSKMNPREKCQVF